MFRKRLFNCDRFHERHRLFKHSLEALFQMFDVVEVNGSDGLRAYRNAMKDFEGAIIAESCLRNGVDLILTYNLKDFAESPVAAMAPGDFVRSYKPAGYDYAEIEL